MTAKSFALLLADLGITRSLNRPYVSNDNPFSESQFKTTKYDPSYPGQFGTLEEARIWCRCKHPRILRLPASRYLRPLLAFK